MKRLLITLLVLALTLPGCARVVEPAPSQFVHFQLPASILILVEDGQITSGMESWADYRLFQDENVAITIHSHYTDPEATYECTLTYDGKFHLTDSEGEQVYDYLISSAKQSPPHQAPYNYAEHWLLSDDPDMTWDRYLSHMLSSTYDPDFPNTRSLFADYRQFPLPAVPVDEAVSTFSKARLLEHSYVRLRTDGEGYAFEQRGYDGALKMEGRLPGSLGCGTETEDGGLVLTAHTANRLYLLFFSPEGELLRTLEPERSLLSYPFAALCRDGSILFFGSCVPGPESYTKGAILRCSPEGEILESASWGGSDFDDFNRVIPEGDGFRVWGWTQSRDGDFPLSKDGYGVNFSVHMSSDLTLSDLQEGGSVYESFLGWHLGQPVYSEDPIFTETVPPVEGASPRGIFDRPDGGYTILWDDVVGPAYTPPAVSAAWYYDVILRQDLDAEGNQIALTRSPVLMNG